MPTQVIETSVTVNNSSIQDYTHLDYDTPPTYNMIPGFKTFIKNYIKKQYEDVAEYLSILFKICVERFNVFLSYYTQA